MASNTYDYFLRYRLAVSYLLHVVLPNDARRLTSLLVNKKRYRGPRRYSEWFNRQAQ